MFDSLIKRSVLGCVVLLAASARAEEISLFNGKDLAAWTFDIGSDDDHVKKQDFWLVQNGVLIYRGSLGHGMLRHEGEFEAAIETRHPVQVPDEPLFHGVLL